jgi:hypothetical protein
MIVCCAFARCAGVVERPADPSAATQVSPYCSRLCAKLAKRERRKLSGSEARHRQRRRIAKRAALRGL